MPQAHYYYAMDTMTVEGTTGTYTISVGANGMARCSCPAHRYNRSVPCKHMVAALATLQAEVKPARHLHLVK